MKTQSILIIEDHHILRSSLCSWLSELFPSLIIHQSATGKDGFKLALENEPDLAIIDIGLPDINGIEVTKSIKQNNLKTKVIILTIYDGKKYEHESLAAGADKFINKKDMYLNLPIAINLLGIQL